MRRGFPGRRAGHESMLGGRTSMRIGLDKSTLHSWGDSKHLELRGRRSGQKKAQLLD